MARVIEREEGRYEALEAGMGTVYRWRPPRAVVECGCGERRVFTGSASACACGADHANAVLEEPVGGRSGGEAARHPWRYVRDRGDSGLPV